jgi:hypothetical protein
MKSLSFFVVSLLAFVYVSQAQENKCLICKEWANTDLPVVKTAIPAELPNGHFMKFSPDNSLVIKNNSDQAKGHWALDKKRKILVLTVEGEKNQYRLIELTSDKLVLAKNDNTQLHFTSAILSK